MQIKPFYGFPPEGYFLKRTDCREFETFVLIYYFK